MKAVNVFIIRDGVLKLVDFGLVRVFSLVKNSQFNRYINRVVTFWYWFSELLFGEDFRAGRGGQGLGIYSVLVFYCQGFLSYRFWGIAFQEVFGFKGFFWCVFFQESGITVFLLICGVLGVLWRRCGFVVLLCRVIRNSISSFLLVSFVVLLFLRCVVRLFGFYRIDIEIQEFFWRGRSWEWFRRKVFFWRVGWWRYRVCFLELYGLCLSFSFIISQFCGFGKVFEFFI